MTQPTTQDPTTRHPMAQEATDLATELSRLGGGGTRGRALAALRFWPAAACWLAVPGSLTGQAAALAVLIVGALSVGLTVYADRALAAPGATS